MVESSAIVYLRLTWIHNSGEQFEKNFIFFSTASPPDQQKSVSKELELAKCFFFFKMF